MAEKEQPTLKFDPRSPVWIGLRLSVASKRYDGPIYVEIAREHGLQGYEVAVVVCLSITNASTAQQLIHYTGSPRNSISRAVSALEKRGVVRRSVHPQDGRAASLDLTVEGHQIFQKISRLYAERDARALGRLTVAEQREFTRLLNVFSDALYDRA